ncbi:MAG: hypothetical protein K6G13_06720 [Agathobacter sp.]|uniref:hypothetical protein n=1 Tax=Agathobacter sp. TaxID=2021311 RepID=UPI002588AD53|nr:hypothetical protein [Agathobacter sp.]MCR5677704.1 hypothetical protein [Agathobacter sp.]
MDIRERQFLEKEIPHFQREIKNLYRKFDREFGLHGAEIPIKFSFEENVLGSYSPKSEMTQEHFTFSLYFISFMNKDPMHHLDKIDLYAHEYAHYMQYHYEIPQKHLWQPGKHGSAWKYCCSLVGAAPTEFYRIGEGLKKHDYEKALYNPHADKNYVLKDRRSQEQMYEDKRRRVIQYAVGEEIEHPKYGKGIIEEIKPYERGVHLNIRFKDECKLIDQAWLARTRYKKRT